jgi:hypothetical protein
MKHALHVWDTLTGVELRQLDGHTDWVALAFSPDGKTLASAGGDQIVRLWEVATGQERWHRELAENVVWALAFSPDGKTLAMATSGWVSVTFNPGGKALGTESTIRVWEAATGKGRYRLAGHSGWPTALAFSADGERLASGGTDTSVLVWNRSLSLPRGRSVTLTRDDLDRLWKRLASSDARDAYQALCTLAAAPGQTESFLATRLHPAAPVDPQRLAGWIADLDADRFQVRQRATLELERLGERATSALRKALSGPSGPEARRRLQLLLARQEKLSDEQLQILRALEILEQMGTPQAREVLRSLAAGAAGARLTDEAKACLQRLGKRSARR